MRLKYGMSAVAPTIAIAVSTLLFAAPATAAEPHHVSSARSRPASVVPDPRYSPYCADNYYTGDAIDGAPNQLTYCIMQGGIATIGGYTGPVDGVMGPNSWKGVQAWLNQAGYDAGTVDGIPGPNTYSAMQRFAAWDGYTGPIDGVMGPNSWHYFAQGAVAIAHAY